MDDSRAIINCRNGDTDAFRHLVEGYQRQAVGHATAILGNREDAADAVQEAFVDAFRALKRFDETKTFYPWFYVLLRNRCYKMAARRRETTNIDETEIVAVAAVAGDSIALERALLSLERDERELLSLKYFDGFSYDELAERLQIPKGTVMSRLYHARLRLRQKLES